MNLAPLRNPADAEAQRRGHFSSVPVVDVGGLFSTDAQTRMEVAREIDQAARNVGFLYITNHGVPASRLAALQQQAAHFFALPHEAKMAYYIGLSRNHRGYVPAGEEVFYGQTRDSKEGFDLSLDLPVDDPDYQAGNRLLGPNVWPSEVPGFAAAVSGYYQEVMALGNRFMSGVALSLGLPESFFSASLKKPPSQLRLLHYPPRASVVEADMGIGSHTDYECFTLLHTTAPGLEVMNAAGHWVEVPPVPGAFVVNIGDMLEVMTNGRWVSTAHRVRAVAEERYSFPLFFSLDYDAVVEPLAQFVTASNPSRYPPLKAGEHLLSQTAQSFRYFHDLLARGDVSLSPKALKLASFGRDRGQDPEQPEPRDDERGQPA